MFSGFLGDLKYAFRSFSRRPLFTGVVLITLALGIGSNVAIFSVVNAVLFRPLPYANPERLALIWTRLPATNVERSLVSGPDLGDFIRETRLFDGFAGAAALPSTLTGSGPAEQIMAGVATWNVFDILGVKPFIGRTFEESDAFPVSPDMFGSPNPDLPPGKVMLSYGLWQRRFGGDRSIVGQTIQMAGFGSVVVGVLPADFRIYLPADAAMPTNIDAWGVLPSNLADFTRDAAWLTVVARLKPGVSVEQAQGEMNALAARLREVHQFHANQNLQITVNGMHQDVVSAARAPLLALLGAVGFVLLIACANVANLLLVRATGRGREIAVRAALGSGYGRIVVQMLTESAILATGGALLGVLFGWWAVRVISALTPGNLPRLDTVSIDASVLWFTAGITALAALIFGLAPTLRAVSGNLATSLKERGSDSGGVRGGKLRTALVVSEVALSLVLLIGAGLMMRSFAALQNVEPGFAADNVITFTAPLQFTKYYSGTLRSNFVKDVGERLSQLPGVERVGGVSPLPLAGGEQYSVGSYGRVGDPDNAYQANKADFRSVLPGFFEALDIQIVAGRALVPADNENDALKVVVIDQKLARRTFGEEDPLDKVLVVDHFNDQTFTLERIRVQVVGVAANVHSTSLAAEGRETIYTTHNFNSFLPITFVLRTAASPQSLLPLIRKTVAEMDPDVPVSDLSTLESYVSAAMAPTRFMLALIGVFAAVALVLASLGLYGVISYSVRQRTREFGVRVAFGAGARDLLRLVLGHGMAVAGIGVAVGLAASLALTRIMNSVLVGTSPTDIVTFTGVPALLLVVAAVATWIPARRATYINPVEALRDE